MFELSVASVAVLVLAWLVPAAVVALVLYAVVRRGVRDGMLDARRVDAEEAAGRRARAARAAAHPDDGAPSDPRAPVV
ncbi:hypothetical protein [Cellulomonas sp.]|uniref:hypothetical protein n=1 Tax=Cellulomonas sp. TaxID=40001 RepID=UPI002D346580|nr:hypothetical protein [Cellulomonas sp.]HYQ77262.1 hypothetical protein [Cellulomonas sp.]